MKFKVSYILLATFVLVSSASANDKSIGAIFLNEPMGARACAMGEAFAGVAEDSQSMFWNPAGLAFIGDIELLIAHTEFIQDYRHEYFALNLPFSSEDALGIQGYLSYINGLEKTIDITTDPELYSAYDSYLGLGWSHKWTTSFSTGVSGKVIYQTIDDVSAWTFAGDMGVYVSDVIPDLSLGLVARNIGLPIKFIDKAHALPLTIDVGASYRLMDKNLLLTFDISKPLAQELTFKFGSEYNIMDTVFVRAGYKYAQFGNDLGPLTGLTIGLGADIADYYLDYAFTPYADLGQVHRVSLTMHFGRSKALKIKIVKQLSQEIRKKQKAIIQGYLKSARHYMDRGHYKQALFYYERVQILNPRQADVKAKMLLAEKKLKEKEAEQHFKKGMDDYKRKDYLDALIEWSKTKDINPNHPKIDKWLARVNRKLTASKKKRKSRQHQNGNYYSQGLAHLRNGHYKKAIEAWDKLLALNPKDRKVRKYLDITKRKMKDEINSLLAKAKIDWKQNDYAAAVKKWKKLLKKYPDNPAAVRALEDKKQAIQNYADELYREGIQNYIQNRLVEAITNWQTVLVLDPSNKKAGQNLRRAQHKIEEMELIDEK